MLTLLPTLASKVLAPYDSVSVVSHRLRRVTAPKDWWIARVIQVLKTGLFDWGVPQWKYLDISNADPSPSTSRFERLNLEPICHSRIVQDVWCTCAPTGCTHTAPKPVQLVNTLSRTFSTLRAIHIIYVCSYACNMLSHDHDHDQIPSHVLLTRLNTNVRFTSPKISIGTFRNTVMLMSPILCNSIASPIAILMLFEIPSTSRLRQAIHDVCKTNRVAHCATFLVCSMYVLQHVATRGIPVLL
ncbi:hypothetical protein V8B97DRAFT_1919583 [Scleroderma yunnanense]